MCGIIGIVSSYQDVGERVLHSIKRLEYRGYDSAGIATIDNSKFSVLKLAGKVRDLETAFKKAPIKGTIGIGHTRWATHGSPTYANAHPLCTTDVAVVHNGIIENYLEIKQMLISEGYKFDGETDTEVLTKLIQFNLDKKQDFAQAVKNVAAQAVGMYAFIAMSPSNTKIIVGVKKGLPLALGIGENEMYFGSDAFALFPLTNKLIYLNDDEIAFITPTSYEIRDLQGNELKKEVKLISIQDAEGKQQFDHYMLKEIYEQPRVIAQCFDKYYNLENKSLSFGNIIKFDWSKIKKVYIIACGTSYYAGMVAKYWIEQKAKLNVEVDLASEFRYRTSVLDPEDVCIVLSQSGETADTLAALKYLKEKALKSIAIINTTESSIGNLADFILPIYAGSEIGVASTKAFTCQLMVLALLTMHISHQRGSITDIELEKGLLSLHEASGKISEALSLDNKLKKLAKELANTKNFIYIGRGVSYPIAMEGALKIKEISYIPAEGIPAGELKHGPIALVDKNTPVCVIAPFDKLFHKTAANLQEVNSREGKIILFSNHTGIEQLKSFCFSTIELSDGDEFVSPMIYAVPMQLLAYHYAVSLGNDVDQPRNLAKSVTVE